MQQKLKAVSSVRGMVRRLDALISSVTAEGMFAAILACWVYCQTVIDSSVIFVSIPGMDKDVLSTGYTVLVAGMLLGIIARGHEAWSARWCLGVGVAFIVLYVSFQRVGDASPLVLFLFLLAGERSDVRSVARWFWVASLLAIATIVTCCLLGVAQNRLFTPEGAGGPVVYAFGFSHPNGFARSLFATLVAMAFDVWDHASWKALVPLCVLCSAFSCFVLSSRTVMILLVLLGVFSVLGHTQGRIVRLVRSPLFFMWSLIAVPLVILVVMLFLTACYDPGNELMRAMNRILNGRIAVAHRAYVEYEGFSRFGRSISFVTTYTARMTGASYFGIDNAYARHALTYGLGSILVWAIIYVRSIPILAEEQERFLIWVCVLLFLAYFVTETDPTRLSANITLLYLSKGLLSNHQLQ